MCAFPPCYGIFKPLLFISYRLTNFFNTLLQCTNTNDELPVLQVSFTDIKKYIAYHYRLVHVRSLDPAPQAAQLAGLNVVSITIALSDLTLFDFDLLFMLNEVLAAQAQAPSHSSQYS
ncbi:hypothetical protein BJY52DRAFT_1195237 [Lactarius psammicola]|nr:hypothetical protein BJY52DRAFT_1195237 [Lactarius psammicola]